MLHLIIYSPNLPHFLLILRTNGANLYHFNKI